MAQSQVLEVLCSNHILVLAKIAEDRRFFSMYECSNLGLLLDIGLSGAAWVTCGRDLKGQPIITVGLRTVACLLLIDK